jgi:hypothetical protein
LGDVDIFHFTKETIEFPPEFCMDTWKGGAKPSKITIRARDILEAASELLVNPEIMFGYKDEINLKVYLR